MTAMQLDPKDPLTEISYPASYSAELAENIGYFYTLGLPEETDAVTDLLIDEDAFFAQIMDIEDERDLRRTRISSYIIQMDYAYYELEDDEWEITEDPIEEDEQFKLPDFIRLTFSHPEQGERIRSVLIPHGSVEIPLF